MHHLEKEKCIFKILKKLKIVCRLTGKQKSQKLHQEKTGVHFGLAVFQRLRPRFNPVLRELVHQNIIQLKYSRSTFKMLSDS